MYAQENVSRREPSLAFIARVGAIAAALSVALMLAVGARPALAATTVNVSNAPQTSNCGAGPVTWHFVINQIDSGTTLISFSATFQSAGTITTFTSNSTPGVIHVFVDTAGDDTLLSATAMISDQLDPTTPRMVLSDFRCPPTVPKDGYKFHDLNANGAWDSGEPGLAGWTIQAWSGSTLVASTTTAANGFYQFNLLPGTYTFKEVCPAGAGWRQSVPGPITTAANCGANTISETLVLGVPSHDNNFGNFMNATKSGMKFEDLNGDGGWDTGEPGVTGWAIHLFGTDGAGSAVHLTTTTDAGGAYSFNVSPGTYTVCEEDRANWTQSYPAAGANCTGHTDGGTFTPAPVGYAITLTSGQTDSGNDFGNFRNATKTGTKFSDLNGNGVWDSGEPGLAGWSIHLFGTDGMGNPVHVTTTTNASGVYSFSVAPGTYTVCEILQPDWTQTYPNALTSGAVDCSTHTDGGTVTPGAWGWGITLTSNQTDSGNDFGNQPPPFEGCTPGFWKNHLGAWVPTGFSPNQSLESVFDVPNSFGLDNDTLLQALDYGGGPGTLGAAKTLLRAAVAAILNAAHPGVDYEFTVAGIIADVNAALASNDRSTMLALARELDDANNAGCPIS